MICRYFKVFMLEVNEISEKNCELHAYQAVAA